MLILTRRIGELTYIGDDIELIVLSIRGNQVRLGFNAPKKINILREEVKARNLADNVESKPPEETKHENNDRNVKIRKTISLQNRTRR